MTREEEIEKAAKKCEWVSESLNLQSAFTEGARWADKTMLDRACKRLELIVSEYFPVDTDECGMPFCESWIKAQEERIKAMKEFITAFRQAMEGGAE